MNLFVVGLMLLVLSCQIVVVVLLLVINEKSNPHLIFGYSKHYFRWHVIFMSFAYILFMGLRLDLFPRLVARVLHAFMQCVVLTFSAVAFALIIRSKTLTDDPAHFHTAHERLGLVLFVLTVFQFVCGVTKFLGVMVFTRKILLWHGRFGYVLFVLGFIVVGTGLNELGEGQSSDKEVYHNQTTLSIVVYCLLVFLTPALLFFDYFTELIFNKEESEKYVIREG